MMKPKYARIIPENNFTEPDFSLLATFAEPSHRLERR
jgi:hypothetical protein